MNELSVSVVIPTYNRAPLLGRAIKSALRQMGCEDEMIVIDDGSTDNTPDVVAAFGDPRIRYVHQANAGAGAARNRGVNVAGGDLIAFLDSDDEWLPGKLALQRGFMEYRPEILFSFTDLGRDENGQRKALLRDGFWHDDRRKWDKILSPRRSYSWFAPLPAGASDCQVYIGNLYHGAMYYNYFSIACVMVRRLEAAGTVRFSEGIATYEEWECLGRLARKGNAAFLEFTGTLQHLSDEPRLSQAGAAQRAESRLAVLSGVWGADPDFLKKFGSHYRRLVKEQERVLTGDKPPSSWARMVFAP